MNYSVLVYLISNDGKLLLGQKKRGFGVGKWNGFGGKLISGEDFLEGAVREMFEESGIFLDTKELNFIGKIHFTNLGKNSSEWENYVYICNKDCEAIETDEMLPRWFDINTIPYEDMWEADKYWLPKILNGEKIEYEVIFDENNKLKSHKQII